MSVRLPGYLFALQSLTLTLAKDPPIFRASYAIMKIIRGVYVSKNKSQEK